MSVLFSGFCVGSLVYLLLSGARKREAKYWVWAKPSLTRTYYVIVPHGRCLFEIFWL